MITGNFEDSFEIRIGQTGGAGYAPNKRWPNAYMGTAFDLGNPPGTKCVSGCIHIFNKQAAAHRLALGARAMIYKEKVVFAGPRVTSADGTVGVSGTTVTVHYDTIGTEGLGIKLRDVLGRECTAKSQTCNGFGFEASSDGKTWVHGNATASTKDTVTSIP
jgi:hypothetical protein